MKIPSALAGAASHPVELTVAELLGLFGERNRDQEIVERIEGMLSQTRLCCVPSLRHGSLLSTIVVQAAVEHRQDDNGFEETGHATAADEDSLRPVELRIRDIPSARLPEGKLAALSPDDDLKHARLLMLEKRFSQLPVLSGPFELLGVVSWQSIAMAHARGQCDVLADAMVHAEVVGINAGLLATIQEIDRDGFVFVRDTDERISGLVTAADFSLAFGRLTGPFLRLGEIERRLRRCVERMCPTPEELRSACGYNQANTPDDLTFGQTMRVFRQPDRWARLKWELPQEVFVSKLDTVRMIRNEVAHFRPDPLTDDQRQQLEDIAEMVKILVP